jgi:hypothetical protein
MRPGIILALDDHFLPFLPQPASLNPHIPRFRGWSFPYSCQQHGKSFLRWNSPQILLL